MTLTENCQNVDGILDRRAVSLVVPVFNERDAINPFISEIYAALNPLAEQMDFEIVFVNDGSTDGTDQVLAALVDQNPHVTVINLSRKFWKRGGINGWHFSRHGRCGNTHRC